MWLISFHVPAFVRRTRWSTSRWRRCRRSSPWSRPTPTRWCELACKTSTTPTAGCSTSSDGRGGTTPICALILCNAENIKISNQIRKTFGGTRFFFFFFKCLFSQWIVLGLKKRERDKKLNGDEDIEVTGNIEIYIYIIYIYISPPKKITKLSNFEMEVVKRKQSHCVCHGLAHPLNQKQEKPVCRCHFILAHSVCTSPPPAWPVCPGSNMSARTCPKWPSTVHILLSGLL